MRLLRRILLADTETAAPTPPSGTAYTGVLSAPEAATAASSLQARYRLGLRGSEAATALDTVRISPVALWVTNPLDNSFTVFPFIATGMATKGATVRVYNTVSGTLLGTTIADAVTGNWSILINAL